MSAQVLPFTRKKPKAVKGKLPESPRFFCLACDTDQFKIYSSGAIHCVNCGARIRNLGWIEK